MPYTGPNYCSKKCRQAGVYKLALEKNGVRNCIICNTEFVPLTSTKIYCSLACSLKNYINPKEIFKKSEFSIFHRDNFKCIYCGKSSIEENIKLHIDHIIPLCKGGLSEANNLVTACEDCNTAKHDILLSDELITRIKNEVDKRNYLLNNEEMKFILFEVDYHKIIDQRRLKTLIINN